MGSGNPVSASVFSFYSAAQRYHKQSTATLRPSKLQNQNGFELFSASGYLLAHLVEDRLDRLTTFLQPFGDGHQGVQITPGLRVSVNLI